jgi:hypothetical protein
MIYIDDKLVSLDVFEKKFVCNLTHCKGACGVQGDSGAPLTDEENDIIQDIYPQIKPFMKPESILRVEEKGLSFIDQEGELVTMIHENSGECVFVVEDNGINVCAIEKLWEAGEIQFRKPVSCHLYPIRVKEYPLFTAVNYDEWDICQGALIQGEKLGVPVYVFLKDALIRRFGKDWYAQLEVAAKDLVSG